MEVMGEDPVVVMVRAVVAAPTARAAFAQKLPSRGALNSRRTQHSSQRQRLRWCGVLVVEEVKGRFWG